jgi:hypothetical protein
LGPQLWEASAYPAAKGLHVINEDLSTVLRELGGTRLKPGYRADCCNRPLTRAFMDAGVALLDQDFVRYVGPQPHDSQRTALFQALSFDRIVTWVNENNLIEDTEASVNRDHLKKLWVHKDRYTEDLISYVFRPRLKDQHMEFTESYLVTMLGRKTLGEVVSMLCSYEMDHYLKDPLSNVQIIIQVAMPSHPRVREYTTALYDATLPRWAKIYEQIAALYGLTLSSGYTFGDLSLMLNAVIDGELMRSRTEGRNRMAAGRDLLESTALAVLSGVMNRPVSPRAR